MGRKCCVPLCRSNYETEKNYTSCFKFPSSPSRRELWLNSINRAHFDPSPTAVVCAKHFEDRFIVREDRAVRDDGSLLVVPRKIPALTADAVPTIFVKDLVNLPKSIRKKLKESHEMNCDQICHKHFKPEDIRRETGAYNDKGIYLSVNLSKPMLKPGAIPSVFPKPCVGKPGKNIKKWIQPMKEHQVSIDTSEDKATSDAESSSLPLSRKNQKTPSAADSATKVYKNKRRKPNPPISQVEQLPSIESSRSIVDHTDSSTSSFLDPNIVIKQEIFEPEDEVPNVSAQHSDHAGDAVLEPHIIKLEKSPSDPILPTIPALVVSDSSQPILAEVFGTSSFRELNISELLVSAKTLGPATYSIVNLSNNLPTIADSSSVCVAEKEADDSKACSTADASTSTDGKVKDQFDAYGKYIAAKLRSMDPKTCAFVQKSFGDIIFKVEMD